MEVAPAFDVGTLTSFNAASILFETANAGRVEMGTIAGENFSVKVSADGTTFVEGLRIDNATGRVTTMAGIVLNPGAGDIASGSVGLTLSSGELTIQRWRGDVCH